MSDHPQRYCELRLGDRRCGRPIHSAGMCALHWSRERSGLDLNAPAAAWAKPVEECSRPDCDFPAYARGMCNAHYQRLRKGQSLDEPIKRKNAPLAWRVQKRLERCTPHPSGCLIADKTNASGYATGMHDDDGKTIAAHRAVWMAIRGPIPKWAQIHHVCANRSCLNPDHLITASQRENMAEMHGRQEYERRIADLEAALSASHCPGCCCTS